ncbi:MAG: hypothetical protein IPM39_07820 [Chloroflexi bacterium]|nr:hypothetical protein [Chloroflexota bacterium]
MNNPTQPPTFWRNQWPWLVLGGLLTMAGFLLCLAPEEATLGQGIRIVYVHVALTWTGMAGFVIAGLLGLLTLLSGRQRFAAWMQTLGWVAFGFYAAGIAMSAWASKVNWGNVFWQEPRMAAAFNGLAVAVVVLAANVWIPWARLRGLLHVILPLIIFWLTYSAPLLLHPRNPISTSDSWGIQAGFCRYVFVNRRVGGLGGVAGGQEVKRANRLNCFSDVLHDGFFVGDTLDVNTAVNRQVRVGKYRIFPGRLGEHVAHDQVSADVRAEGSHVENGLGHEGTAFIVYGRNQFQVHFCF